MKKNSQAQLQGMLLGLAIGDALGAPVEHGYTSDEIAGRKEELRHMHDEAHFPRGVWTDDTSMALCLADGLLECGGYDSWNVMDKYCKWQSEGYRSYFDYGEGIGMQTLIMLDMYASGYAIVHKTMNRSDGAGNGVVMRLAPVVIAAYGKRDIRDVIRLAQVSARETHYSYEAEAAAEVFAAILHNAIHLKDKTYIIDVSKYSTGAHYDQLLNKLKERVETDKLKNKPGYVVYTLQIALWGFMNYDTFEDGILAVMCLGGDVDTTMAVYGQLAGAYYGLDAIPNEWRRDVYQGNDIIELADSLAAMDDCSVLYTRFEEDVT